MVMDAQDINDGKDRVELRFRSQPDFEAPTDRACDEDATSRYHRDRRGRRQRVLESNILLRNRQERLKMSAIGGGPAMAAELDVRVNVTNADEPGSITFTLLQPEAGTQITAVLSDIDGADTDDGTGWDWYRAKVRAPNMNPGRAVADLAAEWEEIAGAEAAAYTPPVDDADTTDVDEAVDVGWHLLARREYTHADDTTVRAAVAITAHPVRADVSDADNNSPDFAEADTTRSVPEDTAVGMPVGDPVEVTTEEDEDDILTYELDSDDDCRLVPVPDGREATWTSSPLIRPQARSP